MKYIAIAIGGLVILGGLFFLASNNESNTDVVEEEARNDRPSFALQDYDGNLVSSDDFGGKLLVVNAWASWCPFCVDELPDFAQLQAAFPEEIVVIAINRAEPTATAKSFSDSLNVTDSYVFLVDPSDSFYKSIGGFSMPETLFIAPDGTLLQHKRGPFKFPEMKSIVESFLTPTS